MVRVIASNQQEMKDGIQQNVVEMRKMKDEMKNETDRVRAEIEDGQLQVPHIRPCCPAPILSE